MRYCLETRSTRTAMLIKAESRESCYKSQGNGVAYFGVRRPVGAFMRRRISGAVTAGQQRRQVGALKTLTSDERPTTMCAMISAQTARRAVWRPLFELPRRFDLIVSLARREL